MPMGNYVIGVSNYVIAIHSTLGNSVIVHSERVGGQAEEDLAGKGVIGRVQRLQPERSVLQRRLVRAGP